MKIIARHVVTAIAVIAAGLTVPVAQAQEIETTLIGGFEDDEGWSLNLGPEYPGAEGSFTLDDSDAAEGASSGLLTADFAGGGNYVAIRRSLDLAPTELRLSVRSADLDQVGLRMVDSTGQVHQQRLPLDDGGDWQELVVTDFAGGTNYVHFGGADDGVWHGPATEIVLMLPRNALLPDRSGGAVRFDNVTVTAPVVLPDLELGQLATGNVFVQPESADVSVTTRGDTVTWQVRDFWGAVVASGSADGGELTLTDLVDELGYYELEVTALIDGESIAREVTDLALLSPFDLSEVPDSPFGTVPHFTREDNFDKVALAAKMGAKNIRESAGWNSVEQEKGVYTFNRYDPLQPHLESNSLKWLPTAVYTNEFYDGNATPYTDEGRAGYANYASAVLDHYDQVEWIEIFNEFNVGFGRRGGSPANSRADYYAPLLKAAYEEIKANHPDVTVVGGAASSIPLDWLEELFSLGGLQYMDVLSIHPYLYPAAPEALTDLVAKLDALVREYNGGESIPIWISEQGYPTHRHAEGVTEEVQAAYLVRSNVTALAAGVEKFFWYNFMNEGTNPGGREANYGIIRNYNGQRGSYVPKPAYVSYATMARQLTEATYEGSDNLADGVYSHGFTTDDGDLRVVWADHPGIVTVRTWRPITVTDLMGGSQTYYPHAGRVHLSVSEQPIYVAGNHLRVDDSDKFTVAATTAAVGDPVTVTVEVDNSVRPRLPIFGRLEIAGQSERVWILPGEHETVTFTLPPEQAAGQRTYVGELNVFGRPIARLSATAEIVPKVEIEAHHVLRDDGDALAVTVHNNMASALDEAELAWDVDPSTGTRALPDSVPAGDTWTADIALSDLPPGEYQAELSLTTPSGVTGAASVDVEILASEEQTPIAQRSITVDGTLDAGVETLPGFNLVDEGRVAGRWTTGVDHWDYAGPDDLSGNVWPSWDEEYLYLSASITDNTFHNRSPSPMLWSGDAVQFTVSAGSAGDERPLYYFDFVAGGTPDNARAYLLKPAAAGAGLASEVDVAITRDDAAYETVYEIAVPWSAVAPATAEGRLIGFSVNVQDNDGLDRKGWIQWGTKSVRLDPAHEGAAGE